MALQVGFVRGRQDHLPRQQHLWALGPHGPGPTVVHCSWCHRDIGEALGLGWGRAEDVKWGSPHCEMGVPGQPRHKEGAPQELREGRAQGRSFQKEVCGLRHMP